MTAHDAAHTAIETWLAEHLPDDLYVGEVTVRSDRDEIVVVGEVAVGAADEDPARTIAAFRERTRASRIAVAQQAEATFHRTLSWGATAGGVQQMFTQLAVPVMTRLRLGERELLDVLVESGTVRSRSEALSWCVALVGEREREWLDELADSLAAVRAARSRGPRSGGHAPR